MFFNLDLQTMILLIPPILLALTLHECAHAFAAWRLGDNTAKMLGRVTLNPLKHLDPIGTLAIFLTGMFGWAKPVPVNPMNFRDPSRSFMLVALAGPLTNLLLAGVFALVFKVVLAFVPVGPAGVGGPAIMEPILMMLVIGVKLNIALAIFNMIPIPPLDGSRVLSHFLPPDKAMAYARMEQYGFMILIVLLMTGFVGSIIGPMISFASNILLF
ncbi:MAG: site-2 protease family protein [Deltaproteobacteria bacterium]|nr:site-2 protease family protein [Deltaproteobacteria bacterium]